MDDLVHSIYIRLVCSHWLQSRSDVFYYKYELPLLLILAMPVQGFQEKRRANNQYAHTQLGRSIVATTKCKAKISTKNAKVLYCKSVTRLSSSSSSSSSSSPLYVLLLSVSTHASNTPKTRYHPCFHADDVGFGTIETPWAMAPPVAAGGEVDGAESDADGAEPEADGAESDADGAEADADAPRLDTIELAWLGATVVVLANELAWPMGYGEPEPEYEPAPDEEPLLLGRTILDRLSTTMSMKTISGPATIALLCLSTAWPFRGWSSDVIQIATGPLIPSGTTHWLSGREREKGMPPVSIWQWKPCDEHRLVRNTLRWDGS